MFGNFGVNKKRALAGLLELDRKEELAGLNQSDRVRREELKGELSKLAKFEEISCRQKSRAIWLREGDNNMKFFHGLANSHRRSNFITLLLFHCQLIHHSLFSLFTLIHENTKSRKGFYIWIGIALSILCLVICGLFVTQEDIKQTIVLKRIEREKRNGYHLKISLFALPRLINGWKLMM